jgi:hypothetical protein
MWLASKYKWQITLLFILFFSCNTKVSKQISVYNNDFESSDLTGITGGVVSKFNGSNVLGQYNNGNFTLTVNNLPRHDLVTVSLDLFIHDSWDGNKQAPDGPDIWQLLADDGIYVNATFSNEPCPGGTFCSPQSYPLDYPNNYNNPKAGAYRVDLPGVCQYSGIIGWTTQYKITKTFKHSNATLILKCLDKLVQSNSPQPKCDESWSVDNVSIQATTL